MLFGALATLATFGFVAAAPQKRQLAQVYTECTAPNTVALTFDDGPYLWGRDIAGVLWENGVSKATFFLNGNNWACIYDPDMSANVKFLYDNGFELGSHTWNHLDLSTLDWDTLHDQFWRTEQAIQRITGAVPAIMRPPYGSYNDLVRQVAAVRGQVMVNWNFDSGDSLGNVPVDQQEQGYTDIANQHPNSIIALNHETYASTVWDVLPHAISVLKDAGYEFVTMSECLGLPAYQSVGEPDNGSYSC